MTLLLLNPFPFSCSSRLLLIFFVSKRIAIVESAENATDIDTGAAKLKKVTSNHISNHISMASNASC